jgi:hypothetical protein
VRWRKVHVWSHCSWSYSLRNLNFSADGGATCLGVDKDSNYWVRYRAISGLICAGRSELLLLLLLVVVVVQLTLSPHYGPGIYSALKEWVLENISGGKARPVRKNCQDIVGSSTSHNPISLQGLLQWKIYLLCFIVRFVTIVPTTTKRRFCSQIDISGLDVHFLCCCSSAVLVLYFSPLLDSLSLLPVFSVMQVFRLFLYFEKNEKFVYICLCRNDCVNTFPRQWIHTHIFFMPCINIHCES